MLNGSSLGNSSTVTSYKDAIEHTPYEGDIVSWESRFLPLGLHLGWHAGEILYKRIEV